jgi:hypothetical protein
MPPGIWCKRLPTVRGFSDNSNDRGPAIPAHFSLPQIMMAYSRNANTYDLCRSDDAEECQNKFEGQDRLPSLVKRQNIQKLEFSGINFTAFFLARFLWHMLPFPVLY